MSSSLSSPLTRISSLDALRGFALLGIVVMHMLQQFGYGFVPKAETFFHFPALDSAMQWIGSNLVMGRFINIFAFLFGLSLFIQLERAEKKGNDLRLRYVWRMLLLMAFGLLCHSFYNVEILSVYALFGMFLIALYRVKTWILIVLAVILLVGIPRVAQVYLHNQAVATESLVAHKEGIAEKPSSAPATTALPEHLANPSFLRSAEYNYTVRLKAKLNYQFNFIGRGYVTFALFIAGLLVGRSLFLERAHLHRKTLLSMFAGFSAVTLVMYGLQALMPEQNIRVFFRAEGIILPWSLVGFQTLSDISLVTFSGALITGFLALYHTDCGNRFLDVLAPYGRAALTNYILQGAIGCVLFAPWAWGFCFASWGVFSLVMLGLCLYVVQGLASHLWLKHHLYGPLEWCWRTATYVSRQPLKKSK